MLAGDHPAKLFYTAQTARPVPSVLQVGASIDFGARSLTVNVELSTHAGHHPAIDWLLRLDLATCPPVDEQWHGQTPIINGQIELEVVPRHWPLHNERWLLSLWIRDPIGRPAWDLVDTRALF